MTNYELFYSPGACSLAVHVLLREIGVPFTLTKADASEPDSKLLKANPRGQVPTLVIDGEPLVEGAAILTYLAEQHESPFLPKAGMERARALQWLAFANSSLHPLYSRFFGYRKKFADAFPKSEFYAPTHDGIQKCWDQVEAQLNKTRYVAGATPTLADILLTVIAGWTPALPQPITFGPKTTELLQTIGGWASYKQAQMAERGEEKSAA